MQRGLYQIISEAFASDFMIDARYANAYLATLKGGQFTASDFGKLPKEQSLGAFTPSGKFTYARDYSDMPEGSIAKINVEGVLMRADGDCSYGMASMSNMVRQADKSPNISKIILEIDSPGGQVSGTEEFAKAVRESKTPVYVFTHLAASAAYWIASGAEEIWASGETTEVGSIGTMLFFIDTSPILEKAGAVVHEIYAEKSTDKNALFSQVRKGDYKAYIAQKLNPLNEIFLGSVRGARGLADEFMTGKTYLAQDALKNGMIDRIGSIDELLAHISSKGSQESNSNHQTNYTAMSSKKSFMSWFSGASQEEKESAEEKLDLMATEKVALEEKLATIQAQLAEKDSMIERKNQQIESAKQALADAEAERDEAVALAEQYGSQAGASPSKPKKEGQDVKQEEKFENGFFDPNSEHNIKAAELQNR